MNYTKPELEDHADSPQDWLNSSLIFARTLSLILKENEGIVVELKGDMNLGDDIEKVIVFKSQNMTRVVPLEEDLPEGTWIMMKDEES
jgi:hypothetical protein